MYKIIEPQKEFIYKYTSTLNIAVEETLKPIVSVLNDSNGVIMNIIVRDDTFYEIYENRSPYVDKEDWQIKVCSFDKYFVEVLRLLPENPKDLAILNQDYYKQMLDLWQSEENFSLDKTILEFEEINRKIEEQISEKKGV